ncbi:MAG TPA: hypothetical protein VEY30_06800 [Myxococcaceae bacterium]|nr:hypothetical protein [Myxococcaceae bacterium]
MPPIKPLPTVVLTATGAVVEGGRDLLKQKREGGPVDKAEVARHAAAGAAVGAAIAVAGQKIPIRDGKSTFQLMGEATAVPRQVPFDLRQLIPQPSELTGLLDAARDNPENVETAVRQILSRSKSKPPSEVLDQVVKVLSGDLVKTARANLELPQEEWRQLGSMLFARLHEVLGGI